MEEPAQQEAAAAEEEVMVEAALPVAAPVVQEVPQQQAKTPAVVRMSRLAALLAEAAKPESDGEDEEPAALSAAALAAALRPVPEDAEVAVVVAVAPLQEADEASLESPSKKARVDDAEEEDAFCAAAEHGASAPCGNAGCACAAAGPLSPTAAHLNFGMLSPTECIFSPSRRADGAAAAAAILSPRKLVDLPEFSSLLEQAAAESACGEDGPCEVIEVDGVPVRAQGYVSRP